MTITRVQGNTASQGSTTSLAVTLPSGVTLGNLLVVAITPASYNSTLTAPDGSWAQATYNQPSGTNAAIATGLYFLVVDAGHAGATSWTWTQSGSHNFYLCIEEWHSSTGWPVNPLDQTANGDTGTPATSTTISSGTTATTTQASELWIAALSYKGAAQTESSITSGWAVDLEVTIGTKDTLTMLYQVASATGAAACSYHIGTAEYWTGAVATFKPNIVTSRYATTVVANTPIRYYRLGEASGTVAIDSGSQAQNGTYTGGYTLNQPGLLVGDPDTSVALNGTTGSIALPTTGLPTGASSWTVECWASLTSFSGGPQLFFIGSNVANQAIELYYSTIHSTWAADLNGSTVGLGSTSVALNTTYHVAATYDGTNLRLYANGVLIGGPTAVTANVVAGSAIIGSFAGSAEFWAGNIDEVAIYSTALSAAQILADYNAGIALTKSLPTRVRLAIGNVASLPSRVRLAISKSVSLPTRVRLSISTRVSLPARIRLSIGRSVSLPARVRLSVVKRVSLVARLRLAVQRAVSLPVRLRLQPVRTLAVRLRLRQVKALVARLRLSVGKTVALPTRLRLQIGTQAARSLVSRLRLGILRVQSLTSRIRLAVGRTQSLSARLRLRASKSVSLSARARLAVTVARSLAVRVRLGMVRSLAVRVRLGMVRSLVVRAVLRQVKALPARARLSVGRSVSVPVRLRLTTFTPTVLRSLVARLRLALVKSLSMRLRLQQVPFVPARIRLRVAVSRSLSTRLRLGIVSFRVIAARVRLMVGRSLSTAIRARLAVPRSLSLPARARVRVGHTSITPVRLRARVLHTTSVPTRARIATGKRQSAAVRLYLVMRKSRSVPVRFRLVVLPSQPMLLAGVRGTEGVTGARGTAYNTASSGEAVL